MTDDKLYEHYSLVVAEYRFQVDLNWRRFQYFLVLSVALLGTATGLYGGDVPRAVPVALFATGAAVSGLAVLAGNTQRTYYRSTRDLKARLEAALDLGDFAILPTPGMVGAGDAGRRGRVGRQRASVKVTDAQKYMMIGLVVAHAVGLVATSRAADPRGMAENGVILAVRATSRAGTSPGTTVVASVGSTLKRVETSADGSPTLLRLTPGTYEVSALTDRLCPPQRVEVSAKPLQLLTLRCSR